MRRICSISLHNYGYGAYCTSSDLTRTRRRTTGDMSPTRHPLHAWRLTLTESAEHRVRAYGVVEHKQVGSRAHPTAPVVSRGDRLRYAGYAGVYCTQFRKCFLSAFFFMRRICSISLHNYCYGTYCTIVGSHPDKTKDDGGRVANSAFIPRVTPDPDRVAERMARAYVVVEHK
jgi:hypothetical protein